MATITLCNGSGRVIEIGDPVKLHATRENTFDYADLGDILIGHSTQRVSKERYAIITLLGTTEGGGITIEEVKADPSIASVISNNHASGSDNQDLSGLVEKVTGHSLVADTEITKLSGLNKITFSETPPSNPQPDEVWIVLTS
jgi:hypothetical protein